MVDETSISQTGSTRPRPTPPLTLIPEPIEHTDEVNTTIIMITTITSTKFNVTSSAMNIHSSLFVLIGSIIYLF